MSDYLGFLSLNNRPRTALEQLIAELREKGTIVSHISSSYITSKLYYYFIFFTNCLKTIR